MVILSLLINIASALVPPLLRVPDYLAAAVLAGHGLTVSSSTMLSLAKPLSDLDFLISGNRLTQTWHIRPLTLLGHGLVIDNLNHATPHNQVLILIDQIGILGALAWLLATIAWGIKYKNYYILGLLAVVGMFDHFFWTIGFLWWWALVGLGEQGYLFRREVKA